jgi:hypothetical protein
VGGTTVTGTILPDCATFCPRPRGLFYAQGAPVDWELLEELIDYIGPSTLP